MLFTFYSTHQLIQAEGILKEEGFQLKVLPLPPEMTRGCGMGLWVEGDPLQISQVLGRAGLSLQGVYRQEGESYKLERK